MSITLTFTDEEVDNLKSALNAGWLHFTQRAKDCDDKHLREGNEALAFEAGQLWSRVYKAGEAAKVPTPPEPPLLVTCSHCDGSAVVGRPVTVYEAGCGFPHEDTEEDPCPVCEGNGRELVEGAAIEMDDLDDMAGGQA